MMAPETNFRENLREKGYKFTLQRMAIFEALRGGPTHPTAEEVHAEVVKKYPMIGLSTVYNTLETLCKLGYVNKIALEGSVTRYDMLMTPHAHLVCLECGDIIEFEPSEFEHCKAEIKSKHGFEVAKLDATFFGYCSKCQNVLEDE